MTAKERLHQLIDQLPDSALPAAEEALICLSDPMVQALQEAEEDDEPTTPDEDEGADQAWQEYLHGTVDRTSGPFA